MIRNLADLIPPVLKAIDRQFLLNSPVLWATRFHYVTFLGLLALILMAIKVSMQSVDLANVPDISLWGGLLFIPLVLGIAFWAYKVSLFNARKLYGEITARQEFRNQIIYLAGILVIGAIPFVYGIGLSEKIDKAMTTEALMADINALNVGDQFMLIDQDKVENFYSKGENYFYPQPGFKHTEEGLYGIDRCQRLGSSASLCSKKSYIFAYKQALKKYSRYSIPISTRNIINSYNYQQKIFGEELVLARQTARENIFELSRIKAQKSIFQIPLSLQSMFFALLMLGLAFWFFVKSNWKLFLGASLLLGGLLLFFLMSGSALSWAFDAYLNISILPVQVFACLTVGAFLLLISQAYSGKNTQLFNDWKIIALTTSAMLLPLIPFIAQAVFSDFFQTHIGSFSNSSFTFLYFGLGIFTGCWLLWNLVFLPQLLRLQSVPKDN